MLSDIERFRKEFERCWPFLRDSLEYAAFKKPDGTLWFSHTKEDVWERLETGKSFFWPGDKCAIVTEFHTSPTGLKSHHTWLAGGDLDEIVKKMQEVEKWGKEHGAHRQTGSGRRGWLKAFKGYREIGVRKEKSLL